MPHVTTDVIRRMIVAARTIHPPQATLGMNKSTSTKKATREAKSVGIVRMKRPRRYRAEWEGE